MVYDAIIIGAGLTGLTTAFLLHKKGLNVLVLEKNTRTGGAISTHIEDGFVFEEGPNTGVVGNAEVVELFESLNLEIELANNDAEKRLILKKGKWHPLPSGAISFFKTPLFTFSDKIKIAFEPLRKKGNNPDESVASLASRRIGQSFVDYAVNPFISGIYAGDPEKLVTRYALPKLYQLEQNYGSFIGGSFKKSREPKSERDKKISRKVFSVKGGFSFLTNRLGEEIGSDSILCNVKDISVDKIHEGYKVGYTLHGNTHSIVSKNIISTVGAYSLPGIFSFISESDMASLTDINYAKVIQVAAGVSRNAIHNKYISFGGLIPQKENKKLLGILLPSFCFDNRSPKDSATLAIYMGGVRHPEYLDASDEEIKKIVKEELNDLLQIPESAIQFMTVFRHPYAIPQYEQSSGKRFETIQKIESENRGLIIAGNLRNGIGIADRIKQAYGISETIN